MEGVADEGGGPAEEDAAEAFGSVDAAPGAEVGGVDFGVDLAAAFYLGGEVEVSEVCTGRGGAWGVGFWGKVEDPRGLMALRLACTLVSCAAYG